MLTRKEVHMFIEVKTIVTEVGYGKERALKFKEAKAVKEQPGFVKLESGFKAYNDREEVMIIIYWNAHEDYLNWKKSDAHIAGHINRPETPSYILDRKSQTFELL